MSKRKQCSCKELYPGWICVSPSQIKTCRDCKRKLAYDKIDRIPRSQGAGAAFGEKVHDVGEDWMRFRATPPDTPAGQTFAQGIGKKDFLPSPNKDLLIEQHFVIELPELDRVLLHGYIDLMVPPGWKPTPVITDYKYTKSRKWIPTLEELYTDPQVLIYAAAGFLHYDAEQIETRWCYFITNADRTKPKGTTKRCTDWTPEGLDADGQFSRIIEDAAEIAHMRRTAKAAIDVEPNYTACQKFGGCEYKKSGICPRAGSRAAAWIKQDDRFKADKETLTKLNTGE